MEARSLRSDLRAAGADAFLDVGSIQLGSDFTSQIDSEVAAADAVLVMIGDDWLTVNGPDGEPRIADPRDWIRLEVSSALSRGKPVIPIYVEGVRPPRPEELPSDLKGLANLQGAHLREHGWEADVAHLVSGLAGLLKSRSEQPPAEPPGPVAQPAAQKISASVKRSRSPSKRTDRSLLLAELSAIGSEAAAAGEAILTWGEAQSDVVIRWTTAGDIRHASAKQPVLRVWPEGTVEVRIETLRKTLPAWDDDERVLEFCRQLESIKGVQFVGRWPRLRWPRTELAPLADQPTREQFLSMAAQLFDDLRTLAS